MLIKPPVVDINQDIGLQFNRPAAQPKSPNPSLPKYHWSREPVDSRDFIFSAPAPSSSPNSVDLRQWCSPIDDQGNLGSCTGNAIAGCIEYMDRRYNSKATQVSRLFIYYYERVFGSKLHTRMVHLSNRFGHTTFLNLQHNPHQSHSLTPLKER